MLWVLTDAAASRGLSAMIGNDAAPTVEEAPTKGYALISRVALDHPLFAPFADPRFGDFTKIHFWKHRRVTLPSITGATVTQDFAVWHRDRDAFEFDMRRWR